MKHYKLAAAIVIFGGLTVMKLLLPEAGAGVREKLRAAMERKPAYAAAFHDLGEQLSLRNTEESPEDTELTAPYPRLTAAPVRFIEIGVAQQEFPELAIPTPEPVQELIPEPEPTPLPAAVTAFLDSQAAFAEYDLPDKVEYNYIDLPFDYSVPVMGYNSSGFGYRLHPILNTVRFHYGTDIAAWAGEHVLAFSGGTVSYAGYDESYGWHLKIDHGGGWATLYAHCSQLCVSEGQLVSKGDCIALVGATGLATGPHLHFELTKDGHYYNPEYYING